MNRVYAKYLAMGGIALLLFAVQPAVIWLGITVSPFFLILLAGVIPGAILWRRRGILRSGAEGERKTKKLLKKLPAGYTVFPDITLTVGEKEGQLDFVVLGKNGIFNVEVKNIKGKVTGNASDAKLSLQKDYGAEKNRKKTLYNPLHQAKGQCNLLSECLRKNGLPVEAQPVVWLSSEGLELALAGRPEYLLSAAEGEDTLCRYIKGYSGKLSKKEQEKAEQIIRGAIR
ncbi:MAG: NERD domain-containing protein [Ruminococcaceae bacterium]|nr:NERD domain-containing protein [Oscillospiraceae bacterium]